MNLEDLKNNNMEIIYKERGGIWICFGWWYLCATWPFGVVEFYEDRVILRVDCENLFSKIVFPFYIFGKIFKFNRQFEIYYNQIIIVKRKKYIPFFADGIKLITLRNTENWIIFWSLKSSRLIELFKKQGVNSN